MLFTVLPIWRIKMNITVLLDVLHIFVTHLTRLYATKSGQRSRMYGRLGDTPSKSPNTTILLQTFPPGREAKRFCTLHYRILHEVATLTRCLWAENKAVFRFLAIA